MQRDSFNEDIKVDTTLLKADIILLQETSLNIGGNENYEIPSHPVHIHVREGNGKGISVYMKKPFAEKKVLTREGFQVVQIRVDNLNIFNVYRSSIGSREELCETLDSLIKIERPSIVCGDFNICGKMEKNNKISRHLEGKGFDQLMKEATHIKGRQIDHVFFQGYDKLEIVNFKRFSPYYSDHDASLICLSPKRESYEEKKL